MSLDILFYFITTIINSIICSIQHPDYLEKISTASDTTTEINECKLYWDRNVHFNTTFHLFHTISAEDFSISLTINNQNLKWGEKYFTAYQTTVDRNALFCSVACSTSPFKSLRPSQIHKVEFGCKHLIFIAVDVIWGSLVIIISKL